MIEEGEQKVKGLKSQARKMRKKRFSRSRLDRYGGEILKEFRKTVPEVLPITEINKWLRDNKRVKVSYSTLYRWLQKHGQVRKSG